MEAHSAGRFLTSEDAAEEEIPMIVGKSAHLAIHDEIAFVEAFMDKPLAPYQKDFLEAVVKKRTRRVLYKACRCRECNVTYLPVRIDQVHCSSKCNKAASNRDMLRGRMLLAYAYNWRKARGVGKKDDFAAMCRELDRMVREDREAGRMGPKGYDPLRGE